MSMVKSKQIKIHVSVANELDTLRVKSFGKMSYNDIIISLLIDYKKYEEIKEYLYKIKQLI